MIKKSEPQIRARLGTAAHFCEVVVLRLRTVPIGQVLFDIIAGEIEALAIEPWVRETRVRVKVDLLPSCLDLLLSCPAFDFGRGFWVQGLRVQGPGSNLNHRDDFSRPASDQ